MCVCVCVCVCSVVQWYPILRNSVDCIACVCVCVCVFPLCVCVCVCVCSVVQWHPILRNSVDCIAHQAPLSVEFSRQEYWSGLPFPTLRHLPPNVPCCNYVEMMRNLIGLISIILNISSVAQLCPTLCNPMDCNTPGLPVYHQLLEFMYLGSKIVT